jgi:CheY-like chemotaxis protein
VAGSVMQVDSKHVLILEDDPTCQEMVEFALSNTGLRVTTADTAVEALVLARRTRFDLIIADYLLPDYPGTDFVRLLRQSEPYKDMPIIMLTGRAEELDRERLKDDLFLLVLSKSDSWAQLLTAIFKCLAAVRCPA